MGHSLYFKQNMSFQISEMNSNNKINNPMIDKVWMGTDHWIHPFPPWMPPEENPMDNDDLSSQIRISSFIPQIPPTAWLNNGKNLTSNSNRSALQDCNPRFKTEICRNFKERNKCIYGDRCQFAHGRQELRDVVRNSKYKTKLCQKYWISGYCAYGPRCNFLHDEATAEELQELNQQGQMSVTSSSSHCPNNKPSESRSSSPTNVLDVNPLIYLSSFNESVIPMTTEEAMAQFEHYLGQEEMNVI